MHIGRVLAGAARIATLTVCYVICFILPTFIIPASGELQHAMQQSSQGGAVMLYLLGFAFAAACVVSYAVRHATVRGIRLTGALVVTLFGFLSAMGQIETWYFRSAFPALSGEEILNIVFRGFLTALLFVPLAVAAWGMMRRGNPFSAGIPWRSWLWKSTLLALLYVLIYFGFGYFVAWQFPETRLFYTGSTHLLGPADHLRQAAWDSPLIIPVQFLRGLLWIAFAVPLILSLAGRRRETIMSLALLGGLFGLQILIPNPLFPDTVRYAHALETIPSTALYGALIGRFIVTK